MNAIMTVGRTTSGRGAVPVTADSTIVENSAMLYAIIKHDFQPGPLSVEGNIVCHIARFVVKKAFDRDSCSASQEALVNIVQPNPTTYFSHTTFCQGCVRL